MLYGRWESIAVSVLAKSYLEKTVLGTVDGMAHTNVSHLGLHARVGKDAEDCFGELISKEDNFGECRSRSHTLLHAV